MIPSPVNLSTVPPKQRTSSASMLTKRSTIVAQASTSRSSWSSIEPCTSAKSTASCLRSPSGSRAAGGVAAGVGPAGVTLNAAARDVPHSPQKRWPGSAAPEPGQVVANGAPHPSQNLRPTRFSSPQLAHMALILRSVRPPRAGGKPEPESSVRAALRPAFPMRADTYVTPTAGTPAGKSFLDWVRLSRHGGHSRECAGNTGQGRGHGSCEGAPTSPDALPRARSRAAAMHPGDGAARCAPSCRGSFIVATLLAGLIVVRVVAPRSRRRPGDRAAPSIRRYP